MFYVGIVKVGAQVLDWLCYGISMKYSHIQKTFAIDVVWAILKSNITNKVIMLLGGYKVSKGLLSE